MTSSPGCKPTKSYASETYTSPRSSRRFDGWQLVAGGADSVEVFGAALAALVAKTGGPTSIEDFANLPADGVDAAVDTDILCGGGGPNHGRWKLWGLIATGSAGPEPLAPDIEDRLSGFTELVATAILTAQARQDLTDWPTNRRRCDGLRRWLPRATPDRCLRPSLGRCQRR